MGDDRRRELLQSNDPLLADLISATDEESRQLALEALIEERARPLVVKIASRFRRSEPLRADDAEELISVVLLRLMRRLQVVPRSPADAIEGLEPYVAALAYHALYDLRRERFPERTRLKNRLRYVLTHDRRLALWSADGRLLAGLAEWRDATRFAQSFDVADLRVTDEMRDSSNPADAALAVLSAKGLPVRFDTLVHVISDIWNTQSALPAGHEHEPLDQLSRLEARQYMEVLWREITLLPPLQRTALLLNLRDAGGANALTLFLLLRIASLDELAEAAGMPVGELTLLWERLPLEDACIGERLGMPRQQIINLRKAARARLARRTSHLK